jgi:hypothetical protein
VVGVKQELIALSDEVWRRTRARIDGLGDDEYFWEPTSGCWTVRQRPDGSWRSDWPLGAPDPAPFTTIAWRLWHLIDMYGEDRAPKWLDVPPHGDPIGLDDPDGEPPSTAADALALLDRAHDRWDAHLTLVTEESLGEAVGDVAGPQYAARSRAAYVLHMLDEFVHHGAEISLLRDLWWWQGQGQGQAGATGATAATAAEDPLVERVVRGDMGVLDDLDLADPAPDLAGRTDLVDTAARYSRWELMIGLVERGAPLPATGLTPLHLAAGAGEVAVVQALLDLGADPAATDPQFHATPRQWARFLGRRRVVELLS